MADGGVWKGRFILFGLAIAGLLGYLAFLWIRKKLGDWGILKYL